MINETRLTSNVSGGNTLVLAAELYLFGSGIGSVPDQLISANQIKHDLHESKQEIDSATVFN